ncbi:GTP-binding protein 2 [Ditylenchus destructor]|uniref:GTP-binding protein 2 n=1 Tax=Ditylenchus destructor TaxID=166010 RepID=A0AAD4N887_9BILA|nr:GTP-binding protein 2 [Ditylenchus destructor]
MKGFDGIAPLPPENDIGNVEYKSRLINPTFSRFLHLATQLKWRLREGQGEAIYKIGVEDDGTIAGLTAPEMEKSMDTLRKMAEEIGAKLILLNETIFTRSSGPTCEETKIFKEVLVQKLPDNRKLVDLRLAILGSAEAGKSTLCGVLTQGTLDNGQGKTRLNLFRFRHEFRSGKTSSICLDFVGFSSEGEVMNLLNTRVVTRQSRL